MNPPEKDPATVPNVLAHQETLAATPQVPLAHQETLAATPQVPLAHQETLAATPQVPLAHQETLAITPSTGARLGADETPAADLTAEQPGRYDFQSGIEGPVELGRGGLGRVILVRDRHLDREVAWKEILPEARAASEDPSAGVTGRTRFLREARITGRLEHPSIVPVYELGARDDGTVYYTMKVLRGRTFRAALDEAGDLAGRLALLPQFAAVCEAVAFAHSRGVIHRDLKPENVMLGEFGETVVLDWGIAKELAGAQDAPDSTGDDRRPSGGSLTDPLRTSDGSLVGTPAYMSPEQAQGRVEALDARSDVWSLGAVLYEVLTGRRVVGPGGLDALLEVLTEGKFPPPRALEEAVPPELEAICLRALRLDPEARYADAKALAVELEQFLSGARVGAYTYSSWELFRRFARRNKALLGAVTAVFLVTVVAAVFLWSSYRHEVQARRRSQFHLSQALLEKAQSLSRDAEFATAAVYAAASLLANPANPASPDHDTAFAAARPESRETLLDAVSALYWAQSMMKYGFERRIRSTTDVFCSAFHPDGDSLYLGAVNGEVVRWSLGQDRELFRRKMHEDWIAKIAISRDGRFAASISTKELLIWHPGTGERIHRVPDARFKYTRFAFLQDSSGLVYFSRDEIFHLDLNTMKSRVLLSTPSPDFIGMGVSRSGKWIAAGGRNGAAYLFPFANPDQLIQKKLHRRELRSLQFTHDDEVLLTGSWDKSIGFWTVPGLAEAQPALSRSQFVTDGLLMRRSPFLATTEMGTGFFLLDSTSGYLLQHISARNHGGDTISLSGDEDRLGISTNDGAFEVWSRLRQSRNHAVYTHDNFVFSAVYSPDGTRLATGGFDRKISVWDITNQVPAWRHEDGLIYDCLCFSPDGTTLAGLSRTGELRVWRTSNGEELARRDGLSRALKLSFSPDGSELAFPGAEGRLQVWNWRTESLEEHEGIRLGWSGGATFLSPEELLVETDGDKGLGLLNRRTRRWRRLDSHSSVLANTWMPSHRRILAISADTLMMIDPFTGARHRLATGFTNCGRLSVSPDERLFFLSCEYQRMIRTFSVVDGQELLRFPMNGWLVPAPNGTELAIVMENLVMTVPLDLARLRSIREDPSAQLRQARRLSGRRLEGFDLVPDTAPTFLRRWR